MALKSLLDLKIEDCVLDSAAAGTAGVPVAAGAGVRCGCPVRAPGDACWEESLMFEQTPYSASQEENGAAGAPTS